VLTAFLVNRSTKTEPELLSKSSSSPPQSDDDVVTLEKYDLKSGPDNLVRVERLIIDTNLYNIDNNIIRLFSQYQARMMLYLHYVPDSAGCDLTPFRAESNNHGGPIDDETMPMTKDLVQVNAQGFVTIDSQPGEADTLHNYVDGFVLLSNLKPVLTILDQHQLWYRVFYLSSTNRTPINVESIEESKSSDFIFDVFTHDAMHTSNSVFEKYIRLDVKDDDDDDDGVVLARSPTDKMCDILEFFKMQMGIGYTYMKGWMDHRLLPHLAYVEISDQRSYDTTIPSVLMKALPTNSKSTILARRYAEQLCSEQRL
jgi:hypothetical protein